jgi:hypothetical protein
MYTIYWEMINPIPTRFLMNTWVTNDLILENVSRRVFYTVWPHPLLMYL